MDESEKLHLRTVLTKLGGRLSKLEIGNGIKPRTTIILILILRVSFSFIVLQLS
jgi:hypothetical protein